MYAGGGDEENDSYRVATEGTGVADDNRTATGTIKSYRKTPFSSRYASKVSQIILTIFVELVSQSLQFF